MADPADTWQSPPGGRLGPKGHTLRSLVGKYVLVGVTVEDHTGAIIDRFQVHGRIQRATKAGIEIRTEPSGEPYSIPPDLTAIQRAAPGEYRLRTTGEVVTDPDFISTWVIRRPSIH